MSPSKPQRSCAAEGCRIPLLQRATSRRQRRTRHGDPLGIVLGAGDGGRLLGRVISGRNDS